MGRPETPIPGDRPMKALAEHLRHLRRTAGSPSYRKLGALVHVEQQSLSQTANGKRVGWGRVLQYVEAINCYKPEIVTLEDVATLKELHSAGERQYQLAADRSIRRRQSSALWHEIDSATTVSAHTVAMRRSGQWETTRGVTDVRQLNTARTLTHLYHFLADVAAGHGIDLQNPARSQLTSTFRWFSPASDQPATPRIRHPHDLTLPLLLDVVRLCNGTDGDCSAWQSAWERIHRTAPKPPSSPADNAERVPPDNPPELLGGPQRSSRGTTLWSWPGNVLRRPAALGTAVSQ
jgi:hypothetical protein